MTNRSQNSVEDYIIKCQKALDNNDYLSCILLHDEITELYFKNDKSILFKLSKTQCDMGYVGELNYYDDIKIILADLVMRKDRLRKVEMKRKIFNVVK